jgi:hypothetical protein
MLNCNDLAFAKQTFSNFMRKLNLILSIIFVGNFCQLFFPSNLF